MNEKCCLKAGLVSLTEFCANEFEASEFVIPYYQRPYAWTSKEIKQLLSDFWTSFDLNSKTEKVPCYIGSVILQLRERSCFHVIDGQQRLTTLFLIGCYFAKSDDSWTKFLKFSKSKLRLSFLSRKEDNNDLEIYADSQKIDESGKNPAFESARKTIAGFINENVKPEFEKEFSQYIFTKVTFAHIILPQSIDTAKYFEIMNTRALQLEKHEILKARLLNEIRNDADVCTYAAIWDACAQMDRYIDHALSKEKRGTLFTAIAKPGEVKKGFELGNSIFGQKLENPDEKILIDPLTLEDLISTKPAKNGNGFKRTDVLEMEGSCESIISFPEFLLLVFTLIKQEKSPGKIESSTLEDKKLLEIIWGQNGENWKATNISAHEFIERLFFYRILFDQYIIKSVRVGETPQRWKIHQLSEKGSECLREGAEKDWESIRMLQAMLHVSDIPKKEWLFPLLQGIEGRLKTQRITSEWVLSSLIDAEKRIAERIDVEQLDQGTQTRHYAFHRLEYLLWHEDKEKVVKVLETQYSVKTDFVFRFRNSVEHIFPQNPDHKDVDEDEKSSWKKDLNKFGNLCLLSPSSNSSLSNQIPRDKRNDFAKRKEIESMILLKIFMNEEKENGNNSEFIWNPDRANEHRKAMIALLVAGEGLSPLPSCKDD
ncbi:MAG TPA: DUF262 domain-containing protein [Candidatus Rifleibacterium sp.]|nr:DUF262 domain-containing protein [Candidatus Rifleibacterium sp.]HPT47995.1 DUF262 domain-containing protein [Candidatus Rifleibacterium sp.]